MINKGICDKGFIWNPSNCESECDKSYDFGEHVDYKNCKCRKSLIDKLVEQSNESIDENQMIRITEMFAGLIQYTLHYLSYFL